MAQPNPTGTSNLFGASVSLNLLLQNIYSQIFRPLEQEDSLDKELEPQQICLDNLLSQGKTLRLLLLPSLEVPHQVEEAYSDQLQHQPSLLLEVAYLVLALLLQQQELALAFQDSEQVKPLLVLVE